MSSLIRELSVALAMSEEDIYTIASTAPRRYKVYPVPKRSGSGYRFIAQPARELKAIQRYVISKTLNGLRIHPMATAYRKGKNIRDNALPHVKKRVIMKLDFKDFFPSIGPKDLQNLIRRYNFEGFDHKDWPLLASILFWRSPLASRLCLAIGAPSSPFVANAVMEPLDRDIYKAARDSSVSCTRYADDITLSANSIENLLKAEKKIKQIISRTRSPKLEFNDDKRGIFTSAGRRTITGLVITPDGRVSLGRERKRQISAALHHIAIGRNTSEEHRQKTRGWLAYAKSVEPQFFQAMARKYPNVFPSVIGLPFVSAASLADVDFS